MYVYTTQLWRTSHADPCITSILNFKNAPKTSHFQLYRISELLRSEGISGNFLFRHLCSAGSRRTGCLGPCPVWFQISPRINSPEPVWTSGKNPQLFLMFQCHFQCFNLCLLPLIFSVRRVWLHLWRHKKSLSSWGIIQFHLCLLWQNIKVQCFISVSYYFPESLSKACSCPERHFSDRHVYTIVFYCGLPRSAVQRLLLL